MKPYYERIDQEMQISGMAGDPNYPPGPPPLLPPLPIGPIGRRAAEGMNELNWHWWPAAHAIRSQEVDNLAGCERTGTCMWGCPKGAKSSTDTTMWPQALAHGAKLVTGARVREITTNGNGLATGAIYVDRDGRSSGRRRTSSSSRATASARLACSSSRAVPTGSRTPRGSSASG